MAYTPFFVCNSCGEKVEAQVNYYTGRGSLGLCSCAESEDTWDKIAREQHERAERRKQLKKREG